MSRSRKGRSFGQCCRGDGSTRHFYRYYWFPSHYHQIATIPQSGSRSLWHGSSLWPLFSCVLFSSLATTRTGFPNTPTATTTTTTATTIVCLLPQSLFDASMVATIAQSPSHDWTKQQQHYNNHHYTIAISLDRSRQLTGVTTTGTINSNSNSSCSVRGTTTTTIIIII